MQAICHIGHHKTGTTTLQTYLSQNSHKLLESGILYPWVETQGAAHALAKAMGNGDRQEILPFNVREAHNALAFRMLADATPNWQVPIYHPNLPHSRQMLSGLENQIKALQPKTIVICSEVMSHFGKTAPNLIIRLRNQGLRDVDQFKLWCTLRRPDEQLVSWHGQQVRFGQSPAPLTDTQEGLKLNWIHVDYRSVIEPWLNLIPETDLVLRPYREVMAEGGSVEDFMHHAGFSAPRKMLTAQSLNISFKPGVVVLLRLANGQLPAPQARHLMSEIDRLTEGMQLFRSSEVEFLGPQSRAKLVDHFAPIHNWLSHITGRSAFFSDIADMSVCHPVSEHDALQGLLDQLTQQRIGQISDPAIRDFLTRLRKVGVRV
ncbi:MAG: hypothetical protein K9G43_00710 [Rhodobacteraceae bacterium]|nr:hypothetical protein [Paracoccaceae bacterium]